MNSLREIVPKDGLQIKNYYINNKINAEETKLVFSFKLNILTFRHSYSN